MAHLTVCTWNVEGKGTPEDIDRILAIRPSPRLVEKISSIVCIQQANLPPSESETKHYKWLCSGDSGSAVLISKEASLKVESFEQVCKEICVAEVTHSDKSSDGMKIKVISIYIPPSTDNVTEELWSKLTEIIKKNPCNLTYILAGDFNAEIGKSDICDTSFNNRGLIGVKLNSETSNENGIQLRKFVIKAHAKILNTFGKSKSDVHTFKSNEGKAQRDYIIVPYFRNLSQIEPLIWWADGYSHALITKELKLISQDRNIPNVKSAIPVVSTWNIQGASPSSVDKALTELDTPVVCVQDIFLTSDIIVNTDNFTWFTSRKLWGKNVGILVKTCPDISMANFEAVSEFLCMGDVTANGCTFRVISCYLPPHSDSEKFQEVIKSLTDLMASIPKEIDFYLAGDFNTDIVTCEKNEKITHNDDDENAVFLKKFMDEHNLKMHNVSKLSVNQVSETKRKFSSHVLMPESTLSSKTSKRMIYWVPFFENAVVTLCLIEADEGEEKPSELEKGNIKDKLQGKIEIVDGIKHATMYVNILFSNANTAVPITRYNNMSDESDLPEDIIAKYRSTPPPIEELVSILGDDFTLYYGFVQESSTISTTVPVLADSFESLKRGGLVGECINVYDKVCESSIRRMVKFRWNGIVVHVENGDKFAGFRKLSAKAQSALINNLGQRFYTVKAKKTYFNKGLPPKCEDKAKLDEVLRVVKRNEFPPTATIEDVKPFIQEFFEKNPDLELVFGPDFPYEEFLEPIKKHAAEKNIGFRWYHSKKELTRWDNIALFVKRTPLEIREALKKKPNNQDLRFYMIPPCGPDNNYHNWSNKWAQENVPEEFILPDLKSTKASLKQTKPMAVGSRGGKVKGSYLPRQQNGARRGNPSRPGTVGPKRGVPSRTGTVGSRRGIPSRAGTVGSRRGIPSRAGTDGPRRGISSRPAQQTPNNRMQNNSPRQPSNRKRPFQSTRPGNYERDYERNYESLSRPRGRDYTPERGYDDRSVWAREPGPTSQRGGYDRSLRDQAFYSESDGYNRSSGSRDQDYMSDRGYYGNSRRSLDRSYIPETDYEVEPKRSRSDFMQQEPWWNDVGHLVILWPINIRSENENNPKKVLEANFPTEVSLEPYNRVAVHVTLPLQNGREKTYCLCVGENMHDATQTALEMLIKHSSVIKHNPNYLPPNGMTPTFVRYNIPCSSNPRTYLILSRNDTGPLTGENIREMFNTFQSSFNEDIFFDKDSYSYDEKMMVIDLAPKYKLKVRHFGDDQRIVNRYVCVYKTKPKDVIVEELLRVGDYHPKYMLTLNNLSAKLGRNMY